MRRRPPRSTRTDTLLPYTTLFRSQAQEAAALQIANPFGLPPLHAQQIGGARHVDVQKGAAHQEIARLGGDIFGELGQALGRDRAGETALRSEEHTSELQSLMRISYAVFCLKKKK